MWECALSFASIYKVNEAFFLSFSCYMLVVKQPRKLCWVKQWIFQCNVSVEWDNGIISQWNNREKLEKFQGSSEVQAQVVNFLPQTKKDLPVE